MSDNNTLLEQFPDEVRAKAAVAFRDLASGLYTVSFSATIGQRALSPLQLYAKTGDSLVKKISDLDSKIDAVNRAANYLDNKPIVGPVAKALKPLAGVLEKWSARTKAELINLSATQRKMGAVLEPIVDTLGKIDDFSTYTGIAADLYSRKLAVAGQQLAEAEQLFKTGTVVFDFDPQGDLKQKVLLRIGTAQTEAASVALDVDKIKEVLESIEDAVSGLEGFANNPVFDVIESFRKALTTVSNVLSPFFTPLQKIFSALEPVLDALDSIFGWILAPLEWALEAVIEATGINDLIAKISEEVEKLLPDTSFLTGIIEELERVFVQELQEFYEKEIETPFNEIREKLEDVNYPNQFSVPTEGDDTLMGSLNTTGGLTIEALGGDDILIGAEHDDTLRGGSGMDVFIGGGGNDLLDGGSNLDSEPDIALYTGSITDYGIVSILENGFATGVWFVTDLRDETSIDGVSDRINLGTDELNGIEILAFDDEVLDLRTIDTYIQSRSQPGELVVVTPDEETTTLVIDGRKSPSADGGVDRIFGALGLDFFVTGAGNDQLTSGSNDPLTLAVQNSAGDVLQGGLGNDIYFLNPRSSDILAVYGTSVEAAPAPRSLDTVYDSGGNDTVSYRVSEFGLNVFLGSTARELLYLPPSLLIDGSPEGRDVGGYTYRVGQLFGIENVIGSAFADVLIGSDAVNKLTGGAGNDQLRGLDGDDILLGGAGSDILIGDGGNDYLEGGSGSNTYVAGLGDDYIVDLSSGFSEVFYASSAVTDHYSKTIDFVDFASTGDDAFNADDMPGGIVIFPTNIPGKQQVSKYQTSVGIGDRFGVDYLEGVEIIISSNGRDIIYTAAGISQTIYANEGDDELYTGLGDTQNSLYGGPGNDLFISDATAQDTFFGGADSDTVRIWGDNNVAGDLLFGDDNRQTPLTGTDTLDFSESNYSWHIYMNPVSGGTLTGKAPLSALYVADPKFIQPTLGVNGTVAKQPGVVVSGEVYPGVNQDLRVADPNTSDAGGRSSGVGEFERFVGSPNRDFITAGNPDGPVTIEGRGGDDVLYAGQLFAATVEGGDGNDVLGTFNHTLGNETPQRFFDAEKRTSLSGGSGNDVFVAGDFQEQFDGGEGIDLLTYEVSTSGVTVDLTNKVLDRGYATGDILIGNIINVTGSQFDDLITGDELQNELVGWDGADVIHGMDGSDQLFGNDGDDQLFGGAGNDVLHGGNGADLLDGGAGSDTVSWNLYQVHPKGDLARLTNDTSGIVADLKTGQAGQDTLVNIENLLGGVGDDQLFGDDSDNFLGGNSGNDRLEGRGGNDVILGSRGDDILLGGDGDDFLSGGAGTNEIDGGTGVDTIDYSSLTYGISVIMSGVGSQSALATSRVDSLTPVDAYVWTDSLTMIPGPTGLADDLIESGSKETRYTFQIFDQGTDDPSDDIRRQEEAITPERIWKLNPLFAETPDDLVEVRFLPDEGLLLEQEVSVVQEYVPSQDTFTNIEQIIGGRGNDNILGNSESTFFYGSLGADIIDGGDGIDTAGYQYSEQAVTIDLGSGVFSGGEAEGDTLTNIENIIGSAFDDTIKGDFRDNRLTLGTGNDSASGGAGKDTVVFEFSSSGIIYQVVAGELWVIQSQDTEVISIDTLTDDIEFLEFTDTTLSFSDAANLFLRGTVGDDLLIGTPIADPIEGLAGNDTIEGRAGDDTLDGGSGNDVLKGQDGNDRIIGGTGIDQFIGGTGNDVFVVDDASEVISELLGEGFDTVETSISFTLPSNVEAALVVGESPVTIEGNSLANTLTGSSGAQTLIGLEGDDTLDGGQGADTMIGGPGNDIYYVDDPADRVGPETSDGGNDAVVSTIDLLAIENIEIFIAGGSASVTITGDSRDNIFFDGTNSVVGGSDPLQGSGNSTFDGGKGNDTLTLAYDFESSTFAVDAEGFLLISNGTQTDKVRSVESLNFTDKSYSYDELIESIYPSQHVQLFAGDRYDTDYGIDMTPEGGGDQFLLKSPRSSGSNDGNKYYFNTGFLNDRGKGFFEGSGFLNPENGTVNRVAVDFSGGNTNQVSVGSFSIPLATMMEADWLFYQYAIFGGDDRITGSYYDDKLVGYRGDDTIFGGLGDKENYNVEGSAPSPRPSTLRNPGDIANSPEFFVDDGDDFIDGREGDDVIDGGTGADTLLGGPGNDTLYGGGGVFADVLHGGEGNDTLFGGDGDDSLNGDEGRDTLHGLAGNDTLDGGADIDIALYQQARSQYSLVNSDGNIRVIGPAADGEDTLTSIERLHFEDSALAFDLDGHAGTVVKMLGVLMEPDSAEMKEFVGRGLDLLDNGGLSFDAAMNVMLETILGPESSNAEVVTLLFNNLIGADPSQADLDLVVGLIEDGSFTQASLSVLAAEHPLNTDTLGLVGLATTGVEFIPFG